MVWSGGKGKGWGSKPWGGKGWGGKSAGKMSDSQMLAKIDPAMKVWVGGVTATTKWKALQDLFSAAGKVKYAAVFAKGGTGCVAFTSAKDAKTAVSSLNGAELDGATIEVDSFTKPAGRDPAKTSTSKGWGKKKTPFKPAWKIWKPAFQKRSWKTPSWKKGQGKGGRMREVTKLAKVDAGKKVWVGGVAATTKWKDLQKHFESAGEVTWAKVFPKGGTACVAYKTAEMAEGAIASLDGSTLAGSVIQCDTFVKPEKS